MTDPRPAPLFIGGTLALDFLNSIAPPVEWITGGEDLLAWLAEAHAVPKEVLTSMRRHCLPGELDAVAAQARALREGFRRFVRKHAGKPLRPESIKDLAWLNRVLARDQEYGQLVSSGTSSAASGITWQVMRRWETSDTLLLPLARAMAEMVCNEDFTHLKPCEGSQCTLFFIDRTRAKARRWCAMAVCGNRAKQSAHRKRQHSA